MKKVAFVFFFLSISASAYDVGDTVNNHCWSDDKSAQVCLQQLNGKIKVIDFNAGWCPPCNAEMKKLAARVHEYKGKPVAFISASIEGWQRGTPPNPIFLNEWKAKHSIPSSVFVTGAPVSDFLKLADPSYQIPNFVILNSDNELVFRSSDVDVAGLFAELDGFLGTRETAQRGFEFQKESTHEQP